MRGLRRALTFWRRSIRARVVASTLLLSTVVVGVVGWFQLQQTRDGLLEHRVSAVVGEATDETTEAQSRLGAATGTETNSTRQQRDLADQLIQRGETRGFSVVLGGPVGEQTRLADGGAEYTPGLQLSSVPPALEDALRPRSCPRRRGPTPRSAPAASRAARRASPGSWSARRSRLPADGQTYTVYYLFPLAEEQETLALVTRALLTAAVLLVVLRRRGHVAGRPAGRHPGAPGAPRRGAARRRRAAGAARPCGARTTSRGWRPRSTRWPPACRPRSVSSRSSAASSDASSRTSPTSCAPP